MGGYVVGYVMWCTLGAISYTWNASWVRGETRFERLCRLPLRPLFFLYRWFDRFFHWFFVERR